MGYGRKKSASSYEAAPVQVPAYNVTGSINPNSTCNYYEAGILNGEPYYQRIGDGWYLFRYAPFPAYVIGQVLGVLSGPRWHKLAPPITGSYTPYGGATGLAAVSEGGH